VGRPSRHCRPSGVRRPPQVQCSRPSLPPYTPSGKGAPADDHSLLVTNKFTRFCQKFSSSSSSYGAHCLCWARAPSGSATRQRVVPTDRHSFVLSINPAAAAAPPPPPHPPPLCACFPCSFLPSFLPPLPPPPPPHQDSALALGVHLSAHCLGFEKNLPPPPPPPHVSQGRQDPSRGSAPTRLWSECLGLPPGLRVPGITPRARDSLPMPLTPTTPRRTRQQSLTAWAPGPPRTDNSSNWERVLRARGANPPFSVFLSIHGTAGPGVSPGRVSSCTALV
jgi:hypothetical protein